MTGGGFVKVRRGLGEHIKKKSPVEFKVFMTLLLAADYKTHSVSLSIDVLSSLVGASYRSVNTAVNNLVGDNYITYKPCRNQWVSSEFTIAKYDSVASEEYAEAEEESVFASEPASEISAEPTSEARASDLRESPLKSLKKERTKTLVREGENPTDQNAVELATLLHSLMAENFKSRGVSIPKSYRPDTWARDIEKIHRIDGYEWEVIRGVIKWSQADEFWSQNILSGGKLRAKMPQLVLKSREPKKVREW
jgi:hypothetical protein